VSRRLEKRQLHARDLLLCSDTATEKDSANNTVAESSAPPPTNHKSGHQRMRRPHITRLLPRPNQMMTIDKARKCRRLIDGIR